MVPTFGHSFHLDPIVPCYAYFYWFGRLTSAFIYHLGPYSTGELWYAGDIGEEVRYNHSFLRRRPCLECEHQRCDECHTAGAFYHSMSLLNGECQVSPISTYIFCCNLLWMPLTIYPCQCCVYHYQSSGGIYCIVSLLLSKHMFFLDWRSELWSLPWWSGGEVLRSLDRIALGKTQDSDDQLWIFCSLPSRLTLLVTGHSF